MKHTPKILTFLAAIVGLATSAFADSIKLSTGSYSYGSGGAFVAQVVSGSISNSDYTGTTKIGADSFLTFCIEYPEHFNSGYTYDYKLNDGAVNGGVSGQTDPSYDPISNATAYLYSEFAKGSLGSIGSGSLFSYAQSNYANLQNAIWFLEGEITTSNALAQAAIAHEGANWNAENNGAYGVKALNLTDANGVHQDQLYYHGVPDGGMTLALLGLGLLGLALAKRRV